MRRHTLSVLLLGTLVGLLTASTSFAETVAERFENAMKKKTEYCATHKIDPANRRCDILKLKLAEPLATVFTELHSADIQHNTVVHSQRGQLAKWDLMDMMAA